MSYGVIGVGAIATAIVSGLSAAAEPPTILLSPRNADVAAGLASSFRNVRMCESNQAVVDGALTLIIAIRPQDASGVLSLLRFSAEHSIISVVAGLPADTLRPLVAPAATIARAVPLPAVARREGVTPILPSGGAAKALFDQLGGVIEVEDARLFEALSASTATIATYFAYLGVISQWLGEKGVAPGEATGYIASMFAGLTPALRGERDFDKLARDHATPGGINELFQRSLEQSGLIDQIRGGLDRVAESLSERPIG